MDIVTVEVERNANTKIVIEVPEYEVAVLEAIHGEEQIHERDRKKSDAAFDPEAAYMILEGRYGGTFGDNGDAILKSVYRDARALARQYKADKKAA